MAFSTNPALNQKLMQLDQEYLSSKLFWTLCAACGAFCVTSEYSNICILGIPALLADWNQNNMQQAQPPQTNQGIIWVQPSLALL